MKFGTFPIDQADGLVLAHAVATKTRRLKKGHQLTADDIHHLKEESVTEVMGALLEASDVPEDQAAQRLAACMAGDGCTMTSPFTGRCNLIAETAGILVLNKALIDSANAIDEAITLATLPPYARVVAGQTIATAKIIPFGCRETDLSKIEQATRSIDSIISVHPFQPKQVTLISTVLPETKSTVLDKSRAVLAQRLDECGNRLETEVRCEHALPALTETIKEIIGTDAEIVLIFGASAITDRSDIIPAAIKAAGGTVDHLGMPVDPGNLLLLGHHGDVPIIGLPGCARSPKLNGFDWVLERLLADIPVSPKDIMGMGIGGLLKEIPTRPQPREKEVKSDARPSVAAIILAAGQSRRMGTANKLLEEIDGMPMVQHVAQAIAEAGFSETVVVTGYERDSLMEALSGFDFTFVYNEGFNQGLSSSLKAGIRALRDTARQIDGVIVCLGDMPRIKADHLAKLKAAFDPHQGQRIVVPTHNGKRGNPVIWSSDFFDEILELKGDVGARALIGQYEESVVEVALETDGIFLDIDTPEALEAQRNADRTDKA